MINYLKQATSNRTYLALAIHALLTSPIAVVTNAAAQSVVDTSSATSTSSSGQQATDLSAVQVIGSEYDPRRDDTAAKIVVNKQQLQTYGDTTLTDALKRLPGVTVGIGQPGKSGPISLRGMGSGRTQILINGQKAAIDFDMESLSPEMIERVEIIRSAMADQSNESIAGTINIILANTAKKNSRDVKLGIATTNGKIAPTITWNEARRDQYHDFTVSTTLSRRNFLVEETGLETGKDTNGNLNVLRNTRLRAEGFQDGLTVTPNLNLSFEDGSNLSIQGYLSANRLNKDLDIYWGTLLGPELDYAHYLQHTEEKSLQLRGEASWTKDFDNEGKFTTKLTLGHNRFNSHFFERGYSPDGEQTLTDSTEGRRRVHSLNSTGLYSFPAAGSHSVETGWEGSINRRLERRVQRQSTNDDPNYFSDLSFDAQIRRLAFYGQDNWSITPRWSMYLGLRWERLEITSDGSNFSAVHNNASVFSPVLQSLWKLPNSKDQIRLALSRTYRAPDISSLIPRPYTSTNNRALNADEQGNPNLRPELATGLDLAYEKYWKDGSQASLSAYLRRIKDVIRTEIHYTNGRWVASPINGGDATAWGVEMDTKFTLSNLIGTAPPIEIHANATRNWSKVDDLPGPNNRLDEQPKFSSTVGADYKITSAWTAGASFTYRTGGPVRVALTQIDSESYKREFDVYALWAIKKDMKLRLSANDVSGGIVTGQAYFDDNGFQQLERRRLTPITVRAVLEMHF